MSEPSKVVLRSVCVLMLSGRVCQAVQTDIFKHARATVNITNGLPDGVALTFNCKSKDDNLGVQVIAPNLSWAFIFRPNAIFRNTLFFCSFAWSNQFRHFDIYDEDVVPNGPCQYNYNSQKYDLCYPRNPSAALQKRPIREP
ncbi:hypothetical protein BT93_L0736 [Corymbia citriodora subsp. variegata]|uniref:S-protein homolog n=1 Tax=Corymbia citriodora subsp. variegata TaxID=360336 RepID=A0A8T0CU47_CORYI|nr:hypothetical protein BT93_L0736 [Corymbia citriodora subsp. variegata]